MATTRARAQMSAVCVPDTRYSWANLDLANSSYTETGLEPGVPVATSVSSNHRLFASTREGVSSAFDVDWRVADSSSGPIGGQDSARWIYRDTEETGDANNWRGWGDVELIRDVEQVNQVEGSGANQYQYPRGCVDKHGNLFVFSKFDTRLRCNVKSGSTGAWAAVVTVVAASVNGSTNNADRTDGDCAYVEEEDAVYVFWPSWDSGRTKQSVGVSVTTDQGATWRVLTTAIVPHADSLDFSPEVLRRVRVVYNPVSRTFTLTFEYDDNTDEWVYTTTIDRTFAADDWGPSPLRYRQLHAVVVHPETGTEYLLAPTDDGTGSIVDLGLYRKEAGGLYWSAELDSQSFATLDTSTGVSGFIHADGRPLFLFGSTFASAHYGLWVTPSDTLQLYSAGVLSPLADSTSQLQRWCALRWQSRVLVIGNPSTGNTDELLAVHLGGWDTTPTVIPDTSVVCPWDLPSNQGGSITWTEDDSGTGTIVSDWNAGYLSLETYTPGGTGNNGFVSGSAPGSEIATVVVFRVEVADAYTTVGSATTEGYVYFQVEGDSGSASSGFAILLSETRFNVIDLTAAAAVGANITLGLKDAVTYFKVAYCADSRDLRVWTSSDGEVWTSRIAVTLTAGSSSAAGIDYEFGVVGGSNVVSVLGYWSLVTIDASTSSTETQALIDYADEDAAYTATIDLEGMPMGVTPDYVTKGLYLSADGTVAAAGELWSVASVAKKGVRNALVDGDDSPRVRWVAGSAGSASLVWDTSDEPPFVRKGFLYVQGAAVTGITLTMANIGGGTTTLADRANSFSLSGTWTRSGNVMWCTAPSTSVKWIERNTLKDSYAYDGVGVYLKIKSNSAGYWTDDTGAARVRIELDGDASGFAGSGSTLQIVPERVLVLWSTNAIGGASDGLTLQLSCAGGSGAVDVGKILIGDFLTLPVDPQDRSRGVIPNHSRQVSEGGYSSGRRLGPTSREYRFRVANHSPGGVRYAAQAAVPTLQMGFDTSTPYADAHEAVEQLESVVSEVGSTTPVVLALRLTSKPGVGSSATLVQFARELYYGYFSSGRMDVRMGSGVPLGEEILESGEFAVRELV